jgi:hypothetical protein
MSRSDFYSDTDPEAMRVFLELQRQMTPAQKITAVCDLSDAVMRLAETSVRRMYPAADEREVFLRAAARRLDRETMLRVYGWNPED